MKKLITGTEKNRKFGIVTAHIIRWYVIHDRLGNLKTTVATVDGAKIEVEGQDLHQELLAALGG